MQSFPTEILLCIFQHLPIYSQRQCSYVCRLWRSAAGSFIDVDFHNVKLHSYRSVKRLAEEIAENPDRGLCIRHLSFCMISNPVSSERISKYDLLTILKGCPNLGELLFHHPHPRDLISYIIDDDEVDLPKLEVIRLTKEAHVVSLGHIYLQFVYRYRKSLNRLHIRIEHSGFSPALLIDNLSAYFKRFQNLKCLSLDTDCHFVFDALIKTCPQLQALKIKLNSTRFQVKEGDTQDNLNSQLQVLDINPDLITPEMYIYLRNHCRYLTQLSLSGPCKNLASVLSVFRTTNQDQLLPIRNLTFKQNFPVAHQMLENFVYWFPNILEVELRGTNLSFITDVHHNTKLNFGNLDMRYLLIDLSSLFPSGRSVVSRIVLELVSEDSTVWYQRDGKWRSSQPFIIKDKGQYRNDEARQERISTDTTAVITVKAANIHCVRLCFLSHCSRLDQIITLKH